MPLRPSPTESATLFQVGTTKIGNDGNKWKIVTDKNGKPRWKKITFTNTTFKSQPKVRSGPSVSATSLPIDTIRKGNDGNRWKIVADKNGRPSWKKLKPKSRKVSRSTTPTKQSTPNKPDYMVKLSNAKFTSGTVLVTDPSYEAPTKKSGWQINGYVNNLKTGTWNAWVRVLYNPYNGKRVHSLISLHESIDIKQQDWKWLKLPFSVGVDAGMAGIFEAKMYPKGDFFDKDFENFYTRVSKLTLKDRWGTIPEGFVTSSGWGDGIYEAYKGEKNGKVIAILVKFLDKSDIEHMTKEFHKQVKK